MISQTMNSYWLNRDGYKVTKFIIIETGSNNAGKMMLWEHIFPVSFQIHMGNRFKKTSGPPKGVDSFWWNQEFLGGKIGSVKNSVSCRILLNQGMTHEQKKDQKVRWYSTREWL